MLTVQFTQFPTLQTSRLLLREMTLDDAPAIFKMRSDERVMHYIGKLPMQDIGEARELIETYQKAYQQNEAVNWAICLREQPEWQIGTVGFWKMDKVNHRTEIGYTLQYDYWRQGIMSEAIMAAMEYCFKVMDFHSVEANTDPDNAGSGGVLEKLGFVQEAYFRENFYFEGQFLDSRIYSKINPYHSKPPKVIYGLD
ncbi:MAG: GNAT family N-acetyltransferase [Phycisphaerae bacterium]|nr:GNAT family N-acetyltransferase [Saprospiraceae bacterium]